MDNPSAFPQLTDLPSSFGGLSTLDYFAAKAMVALLGSSNAYVVAMVATETAREMGVPIQDAVAQAAYCQAEAMLAERERRLK